jgi:cyclophilin family peptidyl-prolyl cis-trans isomerase/HEAT repeat protein
MLLTIAVAAVLSGAGARSARLAGPRAQDPRMHLARAGDSLNVALYARVLRAADRRELDTAVIASALASSNPELRRVAGRTLAQVAPRNRSDALPLLRVLARDADTAVASSAAFGLGIVRDTNAVPLLASIVRTAAASAPSAAWALGEIGRPAADSVDALLARAPSGSHAATATSRALILTAARIRPFDYPAVAPYLASSDAELRWAAAYAVARARVPAAVRALLDAAAPDAAFRVELARALTPRIVGDSLRDRAVARLRSLAHDSDPHVRISALHSLGAFGVAARPELLGALRDRDANVRVAAAQSTATAFARDTTAWRSAWNSDTTLKVRESLLESAAAAGIELPADSTWRASRDWRLRRTAVAAWGASPDTAGARRAALALVHDTDARVRGTAYGVLSASDTARRDSVVQRALAAARQDPDSIVRSAAEQSDTPPDTMRVDRPLDWYEKIVRRVVVPSLAGRPPRAVMRTERGTITITFDGVLAPLTVMNYATLADRHFYDGLRFHRVVPGFVAQDGDPRGDGEGGPGYSIRDELTLLPYARGAVGMALSGPDTGGSQYFLTLAPQPHLTGHYTVFGMVTGGLHVMDALVEGDAIRSVRISW